MNHEDTKNTKSTRGILGFVRGKHYLSSIVHRPLPIITHHEFGERMSQPTHQVRETLITIYHALLEHYGQQGWWPVRGGGAWEVMTGAVLTQHTTWRNVETALDNVERA